MYPKPIDRELSSPERRSRCRPLLLIGVILFATPVVQAQLSVPPPPGVEIPERKECDVCRRILELEGEMCDLNFMECQEKASCEDADDGSRIPNCTPPKDPIAALIACTNTKNLCLTGAGHIALDCVKVCKEGKAFERPTEISCPAPNPFNRGPIPNQSLNRAFLDFTCNFPPIAINGPIFIPPLGSPIILDLGEPGLALTGLDDPVFFDIDADGSPEMVAWTAAEAEDAFLVFDRNNNWIVDDAMELFGDAVTLRDGTTSMHGYEALAEFDQPERGGNGNGFADTGDPGFWKLRLWTDKNHNGISEEGELELLIRQGIFSISLIFEEGSEIDAHGNVFSFRSPAFALDWRGIRRVETTDVFFRLRELEDATLDLNRPNTNP